MCAHIPSESETSSLGVKKFPDRNEVHSSQSPCPPLALSMDAVDHIPALPILSLGARGSASSAIAAPLNLIPPVCACTIPQLTMETFRL